MKYKRILLKLSGEALQDKVDHRILNAKALNDVAKAIKQMTDSGVQVAVVIGAGNIWRGKLADQIGIERSTADYMGMLGTIINSMALKSALENVGQDTRVMSAIEVRAVAESYIRGRAIRHLEKGRVVIFAGGTGNPFFTTDTTATLRAMDIGADAVLMAKNGVDGVYSADPRVVKDAMLIQTLEFKDMLQRNLQVMDLTAISLCMQSDIEIRVFNMEDASNFIKVIEGDSSVGTTIRKGDE
ncbi:MAG: UMP kinase [Bacilli bacterium]|nr:UMP kinase [Bacilli bacterium]